MSITETNRFGVNLSGLTVWSGGYIEDEKTFSVSSGGAATALSECIIREGGTVIGAVYTEDFKGACFAAAATPEELEPLKTSKYITTEKKIRVGGEWISVFEYTASLLRDGKTVLFVGLGCDIGALDKYLETHGVSGETLYTVDLICHGPTYADVQKQYVERLEKRFGGKVTKFSVRYKAKGWKPPFIRAEFDNGKVFQERFYESDFGFAFKAWSRASCYQCRFKGDGHKADLTVGDYWGCKKGMESYNPLGVSVIFCRSDKGQKLLDMLGRMDSFRLGPADMELALGHNRMFYECREKNEKNYSQFQEDFNKSGLAAAVRNSSGYKAHLSRIAKRKIRDSIPAPVTKILRKLGGH